MLFSCEVKHQLELFTPKSTLDLYSIVPQPAYSKMVNCTRYNMPIQSLEWPQIVALKKGTSSTNLAPCLTVGQINLYGDKQTIKYMATLSDMATLAVHRALNWIQGLLHWLRKLRTEANHRYRASKDGHPTDKTKTLSRKMLILKMKIRNGKKGHSGCILSCSLWSDWIMIKLWVLGLEELLAYSSMGWLTESSSTTILIDYIAQIIF